MIIKAKLFACTYIHNKIMTQLTICSSCNKRYDAVRNEKTKTYCKTCNDCRHARKQRSCRKSLPPTKTMKTIFQLSQAHNIQFSISNT